MKLPINWLKDYIDPKLSTDSLAERLTMAGLEVEAIEVGRGDTVLELEITPNRPDCLSILGLAREIGAITGKKVNAPLPNPPRGGGGNSKIVIHVENKKDCNRYIGTLIRGAHIKDAPASMKERLSSIGINAINNAVDITNFVLMETGQPLHAFDFDKLAGGKIVVRRARAGESIVTLDGIERKLDASILVIADAQKPVAIAGIMGGRGTEITAGTKNILLESAHFDMGLIRRASRSLGLRSDSSYRFERNVNFEGVMTAANRATDLLLQMTGGQLSGRGEVLTKPKTVVTKIKVKISDIEDLLGVKVAAPKIKSWLARLGFKVMATGGNLTVTVPSHRADVQHDVDVIEEIARMIGFDRLPLKMPTIKAINIPVDKRPHQTKEQIRQVLMAGGVDEILTLSMINTKALVKSKVAEMPALRIFNPLSQDQELLRPVLLPSFLQVAATNFNRGQKDLRFFEMGKVYFKEMEKEVLGILMTGRRTHDWRSSKKELIEIFDLKGVVERIFQRLGISAVYGPMEIAGFDPACSAGVLLDGKQIGVLGRVDQQVLNNWDIKNQDIYYAGLYVNELIAHANKSIRYLPISEFPAIVRDVSLAVKREIAYKQIEEICHAQGGDILKSVKFVEQYLGDKIQPGYKGLVFSCRYQSNIGSLRDDEVSLVHEHVLQALIHDLNAIRR